MRLSMIVSLLVLFLAVPVAGDDRDPPSPAEEVLAAVRVGDEARLQALARRDEPDPWRLADELVRAGQREAALRFALAAPRPDTARLPAYLLERQGRGEEPAVRAALVRAETADASGEEEAVRGALAALGEQVQRGDPFEQALVDVARAGLLEQLERSEEAGEAWFTAGQAAERVGWLAGAAQAFEAAGMAGMAGLHFDLVTRAWTTLLDVQQGRGNERGTALATMLLGAAHVEMGDTAKGLRLLLEAESLFTRVRDDDGVAWVLNNVAIAHARRGEHDREIAALERALELARKVGNEYRLASLKADIGAALIGFGESERAQTLLLEALAEYEGMEDEEGVTQCVGNLGHLHMERGAYDEAIPFMEKALARARESRDPRFVATSLNNLGWCWMHKGDLERAAALEREAVDVARSVRDTWGEAHALQSLATVLTRLKRYEEADRLLEDSLRAAAQLDADELQMTGHREQARLWLARGDFARAVYASERGLEHSLRHLAGLPERLSASARAKLSDLYAVSVRAAMGLGRPQALFHALESSRAGALLETLENREAIRASSVPETLLDEERRARLAHRVAVHEYQQALAGGDLATIRRRREGMTRSRDGVERAIERIQAEAKRAADVLYPVPATLEEVRAEIGPGDAYVIYGLQDEQAVSLVVAKEGDRIVPLGPAAPIREAAAFAFDDPGVDPTAAVGRLRALLVEPLGLKETTRRLLVSPEGILGYVPFALLAGGRELAYVPSAAAYRVLREDRTLAGRGVLALGDPDYRLATQPPGTIAQRGGMRLVPLPATREEARAVGDVVLLGTEATPAAFLRAVAGRDRWEAIHLACHGLVDPERPMGSALALAFEADGTNLLPCSDVFQHRIAADLAVLSACETGKGAIVSGEGIVGLTRAFMLAGAPRVLVSLWKVDDEATRALMVEFYRLWRARDGGPRRPAAEALRAAQAHVRSQERWKHPYYWAAWVLWGLPD